MLLSLIMCVEIVWRTCAASGFAPKSFMPLHFLSGIVAEKLVSGRHGLTGVRFQVSQVGRLTMQANRLISRWKPKHLLLPLSQISSELDKLVRISALFPFGQILDQKENLLILITTCWAATDDIGCGKMWKGRKRKSNQWKYPSRKAGNLRMGIGQFENAHTWKCGNSWHVDKGGEGGAGSCCDDAACPDACHDVCPDDAKCKETRMADATLCWMPLLIHGEWEYWGKLDTMLNWIEYVPCHPLAQICLF